MNTKNIFKVFVLFCAVLIVTGCEKKLFDHRNKYIGKWDFTVLIDEFNMTDGSTYHNEVIIRDA